MAGVLGKRQGETIREGFIMAGPPPGAKSGGGGGVPAIAAWITCALFVGLAADLIQPAGNFVLFLAGVFVAVAIITALLSFLPPIKSMMRAAAGCALVSVIVFGGFAVLQRYVAPQPAGEKRGFVAALVPPAIDLQRVLLAEAAKREEILKDVATPEAQVAAAPPPPPPGPTLTPSQQALYDLNVALASADPAQRLNAGVEALKSADPAILTPAIDTLYRSKDPALRQLAVAKIISQRKGARVPILAVAAAPETQAFANALQGSGLSIKTVNAATGAFEGGLCGAGDMAGNVSRLGVTFSGECRLGDATTKVLVTLQPTDDFRLSGEARNDQGQTVRVDLPLL
jgi:hypothetical protein